LEPDPFPLVEIVINPISFYDIIGLITLIILLLFSALLSGSEISYFSLTPNEKEKLKSSKHKTDKRIISLLNKPENLLATILISNNFVNVGIVILSTYIINNIFDFRESIKLGFFIQIVVVSFVLLLFGEIIPKMYAKHLSLKFAKFMSKPISVLEIIFYPLSKILVKSTKIVDKKLAKKRLKITKEDLSVAIDLTSEEVNEQKQILKGIVEFGNLQVKEIMKSRLDVLAIDIKSTFDSVKKNIIESGFSRIPVFSENLDEIKGILYIKDLLPHLHKPNNFKWQTLIRGAYFVPESKKIGGLLEEFKKLKIHLAIVIDEYGGTSGIVTLEDILEEIIGDITDEFDYEKDLFTKISKNEYMFEAKILLNDLYKILKLDSNFFDEIRGEAETLAGLILELKSELPKKGDIFKFKNIKFRIIEVDNRRIKKVKIEITKKQD